MLGEMKKILQIFTNIIWMASFESKNVHSAFFLFKLHYFVLRHSICNSLHTYYNTHYSQHTILFFWQKNLKFTNVHIHTTSRTILLHHIFLYTPLPLSFFEEKKSYILYDNYYMKWKLAPNEIQMELFFTFFVCENNNYIKLSYVY